MGLPRDGHYSRLQIVSTTPKKVSTVDWIIESESPAPYAKRLLVLLDNGDWDVGKKVKRPGGDAWINDGSFPFLHDVQRYCVVVAPDETGL